MKKQFLLKKIIFTLMIFWITGAGFSQVVTTFAGSGTAGSTDATGTSASFNFPFYITRDPSGNLYVADNGNQKIRKITSAGVVTTFASLGSIAGITCDASGNIYASEQGSHRILKYTPGGSMSVLAGSGSAGSADGTGTSASFRSPWGIAADASGNIYVADYNNHSIRKITPGGVVTTFAGLSGSCGTTDGTGTSARFCTPKGIGVDPFGNIYVADGTDIIRKITSAGVVTTFAGSGTSGSADGTGTAASFQGPYDVASDGAGNLYVPDVNNHTIRKITPSAVVTTFAGTAGVSGTTDGTGAAARFNQPTGTVVDLAGNIYVAEYRNHLIRKITGGVAAAPTSNTGLDSTNDDWTTTGDTSNLTKHAAIGGMLRVSGATTLTTLKVTGLTSGTSADSIVTVDASGILKKRNAALFTSTGGDATADTWATVAGITSSATDVSVNGLTVGRGGGNVASNSAFGTEVLLSNTTGLVNTAMGYQSLKSNTTGSTNTAYGAYALKANTTGFNNTALGSNAMLSHTTGTENTATGFNALRSTTTGSQNSANGSKSLYSNTTGYSNTGIGWSSIYSNTTGYKNTATGNSSLATNTTGYSNTANGVYALFYNTTGNNNISMGESALESNTTGSNNTSLGFQAGFGNTTGSNNVFLGYQAGRNATGSHRLFIANNSTNTLIYGEFDTARVGINTTSPKATLDVNGTARISGLTAGAASDSVVTVDANGNLRMRNAAAFAGGGGSGDATSDDWTTSGANTTISSNLGVTGNQTISGTLGVNGATTLTSLNLTSLPVGASTDSLVTINTTTGDLRRISGTFLTNLVSLASSSANSAASSASSAASSASVASSQAAVSSAAASSATSAAASATSAANSASASETAASSSASVASSQAAVSSAAASSATSAAASASSAATSASASASASASSASTASTAASSATSAAASAAASATSATSSASTASVAASMAGDSALAARVYAISAANSANASAVSAATASASESAAATSASLASTQAAAASSAASSATSAAANAAASATSATSSASTASIAASKAGDSALAARVYAISAANSATTSAGSAATAVAQATIASSSASSATDSAISARNSAIAAVASATTSSNSATASGVSADSALNRANRASSSALAAAASAAATAAVVYNGDTSKDDWRTTNGSTKITSNTMVIGNDTVSGNSHVGGNHSIAGTLSTSGNSSFTTVSTSGMASMASATVAGNLDVTGTANLSNLSISGITVGRGGGNQATNTALGSTALGVNSSGINNTATGALSAKNLTTGSNNTILGYNSAAGLTIGSWNTIIGSQPITTTYAAAMTGHLILGNTGGGKRHIVGFGDGNIYIGANSGTSLPANVPANKLTVYNGTTTGTYTTAGWAHSSDARLKENIKSIENPLEMVNKLNGVYYDWKGNKEAGRQLGFIAQDVKKVIPEVVVGTEGEMELGETLGMVYQNLVPVTVEAIKELYKENQELKKQNQAILARLDNLEKTSSPAKQQLTEEVNTNPIVLNMDVLYQNIPNPTRDQTTIGYFLAKEYKDVYISVFTAEGKLIESVKLASKKGPGSIKLSLGNLNNGVYIYNLIADEKIVDVKKLELVK